MPASAWPPRPGRWAHPIYLMKLPGLERKIRVALDATFPEFSAGIAGLAQQRQ